MIETRPRRKSQRGQADHRSPAGLNPWLCLDPEPRDVQVRLSRRRHIADVPQRAEAPVAGNGSPPTAGDARIHELKVRANHTVNDFSPAPVAPPLGSGQPHQPGRLAEEIPEDGLGAIRVAEFTRMSRVASHSVNGAAGFRIALVVPERGGPAGSVFADP